MSLKKGRPRTREVLASNLARLMADRGWTQMQAAKYANVSQRTISMILRCQSAATIETTEALAKALGVEAWTLLLPPLTTELEKAREVSELIRTLRGASDSDREVLVNLLGKFASK